MRRQFNCKVNSIVHLLSNFKIRLCKVNVLTELLGLFVYSSGDFTELASVLERHNFEPHCRQIRSVETGYGNWFLHFPASYPDTYRANLIIYRKDVLQEILVIPYRIAQNELGQLPDEAARLRFTEKVRDQISELVKIACQRRAADWRAEVGYKNLLNFLDQEDAKVYPWLSGEVIAVIRVPAPIDKFIGSLYAGQLVNRQIAVCT